MVHAAGFLGTNSVESFVHVGHDMKAVEDMQSLGAVLAEDLQMASSPFQAEWRGAHYAEESVGEQQMGRSRPNLLAIMWNRATLGGHLEVHMSDRLFSHEMWLSKLGDHLGEERYAAGTSRQCLAAARHFLRYLGERHADVKAAQPADVEAYLQRARRAYRRGHGHPPDYKG